MEEDVALIKYDQHFATGESHGIIVSSQYSFQISILLKTGLSRIYSESCLEWKYLLQL